jgi:uncharacterized membrane protein
MRKPINRKLETLNPEPITTKPGKPETIIKTLDAYRGKVLQTSLSHRDEDNLRRALQEVNESK